MKIPFGKHKDQDIDILRSDTAYAEWMVEQDWVEAKYPELFFAIKELLVGTNKNLASESMQAKDNFLLSMALKEEKIEDRSIYPFTLPVVKHLNRTIFHPHVTYLVGENGSGKSTLLEALAVSQGFNAEGGTVNFSFSTRPSHSSLHEYLRIAKGMKTPKSGFFLRAESFYNVATAIDDLGVEQSYGGKSLHEQSHGEAFFSLMTNRFGSRGLYILDEPESALSPNRQMSMLTLIHELVKQGSQFIIATHSPILLSYPSSTIYEIGNDGLTKTAYEDTQTFRISKDFLDNRTKMLKILLD